jgi:hypothetical protein
VIGQRERHLKADEALGAVLGYTCALDLTARDRQKTDLQWFRAKAADRFCPLGPWLETDLDPRDLRVQTRILGDAFDEVILYQDAAQRGRADGEVIALLRDGLRAAKRTQRIDEIRGEFHAMDLALDRLGPGDLCLILVDQVPEALAHLAQRTSEPASVGNSVGNSVATSFATSSATSAAQ